MWPYVEFYASVLKLLFMLILSIHYALQSLDKARSARTVASTSFFTCAILGWMGFALVIITSFCRDFIE